MPLRSLVAAAAGLVLALAYEPVAIGWLVPLGVAGLVLTTRGLRWRSGWLPGLCFGVVFYLTMSWWMHAVGLLAWLGMGLFMALFYAVLGSLAALLQTRPGWPVWVAAAWTVVDLASTVFPFSGMPWGRLGFTVADTPLAPALAYVGFTGVGFALALLGALLAQLVVSIRVRGAAPLVASGCLAGLLAVMALPVLRPWHPHEVGQVRVAAVQGNVPGNGDDILDHYREVTSNHVQATMQLAGDVSRGEVAPPAFVVWPENTTAIDPFEDQATNAGITAAVDAIGVPVLVGAIADGGPEYVYNQGIVWNPGTGAAQRYTKHHPVVFGEYIPFRHLLNRLQIGKLKMVSRDMIRGTSKVPLSIAGIEVADAICFDVAYDDVFDDQLRRGAQLITVQTSNATFIHTDQIEQQFAITRLRAIETGRWVVVASINGVSGVIAPDGRVVSTVQPRTKAVLVDDLGLVSGLTPAVRLGSWPDVAALLLLLLGLVSRWLTPRRAYRRSLPGQPVDHDDPATGAISETSRTEVTV